MVRYGECFVGFEGVRPRFVLFYALCHMDQVEAKTPVDTWVFRILACLVSMEFRMATQGVETSSPKGGGVAPVFRHIGPCRSGALSAVRGAERLSLRQ